MASSKLHTPHSGEALLPGSIPREEHAGVSSRAGVAPRRRLTMAHAAPLAYLLPALVLYALFVLWPMVRLGILSLQQWDGFTSPVFVGLDNYAALWSDPGFSMELEHSLLWLGVTLIVPVALGLSLALTLQAAPVRVRSVVRALLLVPLLLPTVLIAVVWRLFYNPYAGPLTKLLHSLRLDVLAGDWLGDPHLALPALLVVACWASFGLSMLICEAALLAISADTVDAAQLDGAGSPARLRYITLPALRGALPLAIIATAFCAAPSYDLVLLMTNGGPGYATTTLALDAYGRAFGGGGQIGMGAAISCLQEFVGVALAVAALAVARGQERTEDDAAPGSRIRSGGRIGRGAAGVTLPLAALVVLAPLAWLVVLALRNDAGATVWTALPEHVRAVWEQGFGSAILTSLAVAAAVAAVTTSMAIPAGFALATSRGTLLQRVAGVLLALGLFQPVAVLIIPLFDMLQRFHLLDTGAGLVLPQVARVLPAAVLLLWLGMRNLPAGVMEAATLDGAAPRHVLCFVALPLVYPLLVVTLVWAFLVSWNDYLLPTVVVADEGIETVPTALAHLIGRFDTEYGLLATGALLALLPLLALYSFLYGVLARGLRGLRAAP